MSLLTSSGRAKATSAEASRRSQGGCCSQSLRRSSPLLHRLVLLAATATLALLLTGTNTHRGGVLAAGGSGDTTSSVGNDPRSPDYIFENLKELNTYTHGLPYAFHHVELAEPRDSTDSRGASAVLAREFAGVAESEVAEALRLYPTTTTTATVAAAVEGVASEPRLSSRVSLASSAAQAADENVSAASMCAADFTCPRSSVAWASGTFTTAGLLTPHSLALPLGLQLRLSLCCQYRFDGTLLRSRAVYDAFLQELLQASPFQSLSPTEKRLLFPQQYLYVVDTWGRRRVYNTSYTPTAADVAAHNDGDGDVLVLTTGVLTPTALRKVVSASPSLTLGSRISRSGGINAPASGLSGDSGDAQSGDWPAGSRDEAGGLLASTDMQLRITNRVLKCKCPHILTVMPLLHLRRDALPAISIAGLGSHCGVQPTQNRSAAATSSTATTGSSHQAFAKHRVRQVRSADGTVAFATSFELQQRLPPTTLVRWTIRTVDEREAPERGGVGVSGSASLTSTALRHTRVLPIEVDAAGTVQYSTAASPFFLVEPNVRYAVTADVWRGPLQRSMLASVRLLASEAGLTAEGNSDSAPEGAGSAADATLVSSQYWQHLLVSRSAAGRFVLRLPLNRSWPLPLVVPAPHFGMRRWMRLTNATMQHDAVAAALNPQWWPPSTEAGAGAGIGASSGGSWFGLGRWVGGAAGASAAPNRTLFHYGYWDNAPLTDQLRPQHAWTVKSNPFTDSSPAGVSLPLFLGRNLMAYMVRDVDDVCDPVVLEGHEVWAVQSLFSTAGPLTACGTGETDIAAVVLRDLYQRMRSEARIAVTVPNTSWSVDTTLPAAVAAEGDYRCSAAGKGVVVGGAAASPASPDCWTVADVAKDGSGCFAELHMRQRGVYAVVWTVRVAVAEPQLVDAGNLDPAYATVAARGPANQTFLVEVRSDPLLVVRRMTSYPAVMNVELPMHARRWSVAAPRSTASSDSAASGYWRSRLPIRVISVDEHQRAEIDTNDVPNVQQTLPNRTLEFVAQDKGEVVAASTRVGGAVKTITYTSRCPDTVVDYRLVVVAFPPLPILPAYAPIYTEEDCVVLVPPRELRKDEVAEWHVPPCAAEAHDGAGPYLIERRLSAEELEEHAYVVTGGDGGAPYTPHATRNDTASGRRRTVPVLMACGVVVQQRCDLVWTAHNVLAAVHKTYSLRRCQRPPEVLFHPDARQQRLAYPEADVWPLPSLEEAAYVRGRGATSSVSGSRLQRRQRQVIPIAGYEAAVGYSFNYTGLQEHFAMHLSPLPDEAANQLMNTRHDYVGPDDDGVLVLRRRVSVAVQAAQSMSESGTSHSGSGDGSDGFWETYADNAAGGPASTSAGEDAARAAQRRLRDQQQSREIDQHLGETYIVVHDAGARRLRVAEVGNASLYLMDYAVRGSTAVRTAAAEEDRREFARRGLCVERPGAMAVLALTPRGSVKEDERYGTVLPAPPAPAVAVLPFCAPHYAFARFPELSTVYGYDYTWSCPEAGVMTVTKYHPTYSVLSHTPELGGNAFSSSGSSGSSGGGSTTSSAGKAGTLCELTLTNRITQTERRDWFLVQRVYPSPLPTTALVVLSDNAADSLQIVPDATASRLRTARAAHRNANVSPNANATHPTVTVEELYKAPANTYPFAKARRVVGKSVVLHVDAPAGAGPARWAMQSLVPTVTTSVGTQVLLSGVEFRVLHQHPAVVARGGHAGAGSTVHVTGLLTPGLYTVTHTLPDPENPSVCPPVTLTDMLDVFHARVVERELFVCGDTAALMAVPVPREIAHEFVGQWEVMSLATDESTVWTAGVNFTGIRFERGARAETLVHGLPFGIVTIRWAIYRLLTAADHDARQFSASATTPSTQRQRVLVDYDAVEVYVLTENLPSNRLVTLADEATILTTSSSQQWRVEEVATSMGGSSEAENAAAAAAAAVRLTHHAILNYSHSAVTPFLEALRSDEAGRAQLHTYYGLQPRPGSGALTLQHLPIGTTYLRYDVVPSQSLFGRMVGHSCALQGFYEVERVSAYVAATTTLDHECDAYTGRGRITLCLNTDGVAAAAAAAGAAGSGSGSSSSRSRGGAATASPGRKQSVRRGAQPNAHFWQSQVRLVAPELLEDVVKRGAREVEQRSGGRCATPWWVAPTTRWSGLTYTAASRPSAGVELPGRCATFAVQAGRHLSPREVAQPLFVAVPRPASQSTPAAAAKFGDAAGAASACPFHGDFISSRIIDGAPLAEAGQTSAATTTQTSPPSSRSFLGLSQLFHLGLPLAARDGEGGAGVHFLPVLQPTALRRLNATMRPIIALRGVDDDVTSELSVSGFGVVHRRSVAAQQPEAREAEPAAATVLLRLDLTNPRHMGGYTVTAAGPTTTTIADGVSVTEGSLVHRCVEGTVKGADVLQFWSETNRPDGRVDRTAQEWLDYVHAVRDVPVVCDVLFPSLEHLVEEGYDPSFSPPQPADPLSAASESSSASPPSPQQRRGWRGRRTRTAASSPSTAAAASSSSSPPYVSLAEMEAQVDRIRRRYRWTADGIDVTGLSPDLQSALSHRRITTTQLRAIEAARRSRQAAEEAAEQQRQQQHQGAGRELENAPSQLTPVQRLARALQAYRGVTQGGEVAVLRVRLPVLEAFTVPYDLFLRTALHKDVVCGTAIDPPPALPAAGATAQPTVSNPHALVALGRLEIRDTPPLLRLSPPVVKQCEVEGGLPVLTFELSGARFAHDRYAMDEVVLEEVANPQLVKSGLLPPQQAEVGLTACVAEMRRGVKAVVEEGSHKRLYVHLSACPFFKMLTPEEYNEHQDSEALLRRLQFSRYLRVTVRRAIQPDSFLSRRSAAAHTAVRQSAGGSGESDAGLLAQNWTSFTSADAAAAAAVSPSSTDASFIVEVRPTLARLHLRSAADMTAPPVTVTRSAAGGRTAQASGGSAEGSWWSRAISSSSSGSSSAEAGGVHASTGATDARSTSTSATASSTARYAFAPTPARPLLVCESDLRRYGFQLGIELIGDTWTSPVGEESASASTASHGGGREHAALPRQRAPPNVALINSFSVVEHHSLDSSHHLYLKGGGVYRSHFINYLFSTLLSDPAVLQSHTFVHQYNTTFASVVIPAFSAVPPRRAAAVEGERHLSGYNADPRQQQLSTPLHQQRPSSPISEGSAPLLPAVRQFCKVEEVLFAVPGIATECQGCLLADTTFFVAGDLTGVWSPRSAATTSADATRNAATAAVAGATGGWTSADFTRPLVIPWDTVAAIPTQWGFDWICPSAAHHALERLAQHVGGGRHGALAVVMDVVVYRVRSITGEELPAELRPTVLLSTAPVPLRTVLERNRAFSVQSAAAATWTGRLGHAVLAAPLLLTVNASVTGAAYTQVTNDVLRYRRHARTAMDYHRDAAGRLVVNASVFLNVCAGPTACTVVSITDALLATEAPVVAVRSGSWVWRLMGLGGSSVTPGRGASAHARRAAPFSVVALLHHAFMAYLCYTLLPLLGVVVVTRARGSGSGVALSESFLEDQQRARLAYTAMVVISLFFSFAFLPVVWTGLCLLLWTLSLYHSRRPELVLLFVASVLYAHFLL